MITKKYYIRSQPAIKYLKGLTPITNILLLRDFPLLNLFFSLTLPDQIFQQSANNLICLFFGKYN